MNSSTIFVLIIVMIIHGSLGQDEGPACPNRKALPFSSIPMNRLPQNWWVNRLAIMKQLPASATDPPTENCCVPLSYLADCKGQNPIGGIRVFREWQADGGFIKITYAYSDKFKNIAEFWEVNSIYDTATKPNLIYGGFLRFMYLHSKDKKKREIKSFDFPPLILFAAAREYAIVHIQSKYEWIHYMDCDGPGTWIEISEAVVNEKRVDAINKEIDQYLTAYPNLPIMELIPTVLPFEI